MLNFFYHLLRDILGSASLDGTENSRKKMKKPTKKIAVTGASGQIAYQLLFRIASGELFGFDQPIELKLFDLESMQPALSGVFMELEDGAYPLVEKLHQTHLLEEAFSDIDFAILIGSKPRTAGMERKDLIQENAKIFVDQGQALDRYAKKTVQVLVVGNPCNTNCLVAIHQLKRLTHHHFHAMTRLDYNRALFHLSKKIQQPIQSIHNLTIWGNHSTTQVPDPLNVICYKKPLSDYVDRDYLEDVWIPLVQNRGASVIAARGKSSAASAAQAIIDAIKSLMQTQGHPFSSAVLGRNNPYGMDPELVFSYPCITEGNGFYQIRPGFIFDELLMQRIKATEKELQQERDQVRHLLKIF